jgi:hypothetical protein
VDARVQGLDPAVHHFGKTGDGVDARDFHAGLRQFFRGAAGADDFDAHLGQRLGKLDDALFVGDTDECGLDGNIHFPVSPL